MVRLGTVPYLNAVPLTVGLEERSDVRVVSALPSRLAAMLQRDEIDAALVSSVEVFRQPGLAVVPGGCIASSGDVQSVLLVSDRPPSLWQSVALDGASLTAAAQVRILLETRLRTTGGIDYLLPDVDEDPLALGADATLLIGDRALRRALRGPEGSPCTAAHLDVGQLWEDLFRVPFVYAVWLTRLRDDDATRLHEILEGARAQGLLRLEELAHREGPPRGFAGPEALDYLSRRIHYSLGEKELEGLRFFGRAAASLGLCGRPEPHSLAAGS